MKNNDLDKFATKDRKKKRQSEQSVQSDGQKKFLQVLRIALPIFIVILAVHLAISVVTLTAAGEDYTSAGGRIGTIEAIYAKGFLGFFSIIFIGLIVFWCSAILIRIRLKTVAMISLKILLFWFFLSLIFGLMGLDTVSGIAGDFLSGTAQNYLGGFGAWLFTFGFFMLYLWFLIGVYYLGSIF